jgi:hypothetical protein
MTNEQDPAVLAYAKVYTHSDRLFDSLNALEELGGIARAAKSAGWSPKALNKALASLRATRDAIDGQLAALRSAAPQPSPSLEPDRSPLALRTPAARSRVSA